MSLSTIFAAVVPLFLIAGCRTLQQTPQELKARETLRTMTRGEVLPGEQAVAAIESDFPNTTAGALARIVRARIRLKANDFVGAVSLLDSRLHRDFGLRAVDAREYSRIPGPSRRSARCL